MKKSRWLVGVMAGALLVSNTSLKGQAAVGNNNPTGDEHTTFGIMVAAQDPTNVQFEVPLYVTMAVVSNDANVRTPQGYNITNTAAAGGPDIGIISMSLEAVGTWTTVVTAAELNDPNRIMLSIGNCAMPAAAVGLGRRPVTLAGDFGTPGNPTRIIPQGSLSANATGMAITGQVQNIARTDNRAAAQFRIRYTVAPLDGAGRPLGAVYVGDDQTAAGL